MRAASTVTTTALEPMPLPKRAVSPEPLPGTPGVQFPELPQLPPVVEVHVPLIPVGDTTAVQDCRSLALEVVVKLYE